MKARASATAPLPFRVYLSDGSKREIISSSPQTASAAISKRLREEQSTAFITKVKLVKSERKF
jgi:hypothetical protein